MKRLYYLFMHCCFCGLSLIWLNVQGQFSLTVAGYSQNFDGLGTGNSTPAGGDLNIVNTSLNGWYFSETGGNADIQINAGTGSSATGDTYNFGSNLAVDRTLGGLQSGSLNPTVGFYFTNNTGFAITSIAISYTGEQWRLGTTGRTDRIDFQYSADATSLVTGNWLDLDALDFTAPVTSGTTGALVGNLAANQTNISGTIISVYIPNGSTFFLRWTDFDATGSEDGLGIDNFGFTASFTAPGTGYYRTILSGNWIDPAIWESSPDNVTWGPATVAPNSFAETITIRNTHTVNYAAFLSVDEVIINSGGILNFSAGTLAVNDGPGNDIDIQNGGTLILSVANNTPSMAPGSPVINISTNGILQVNAGGMTGAGTGVNASNYVYQHQSILEVSIGFTTSGVTYFPNVNTTTIPVFRTINTGPLVVGANAATTFNGVFEAAGAGLITWQNSGNKIFRNGIRGTGNITANLSAASAKFIINGATAELGGTGSLTVPVTGGLEIGTNSYVTLISDKTVTGDVHLLSNSFVEHNTSTLTVTGAITGASSTSHFITNGSGFLRRTGVGAGPVNFPIGHSSSSYNPVTIANPGTAIDFSIRVEQGINPAVSFPTYGVDRTWNINTSANPSAAVTTTFQYEASHCNPGVLPQPQDMEVLRYTPSVWNIIAPNIIPTGSDPYIVSTSALTTFNTPFALGRNGGWVLPVKLVSFHVNKNSSSSAQIMWELAACCSKDARFEIQRSFDRRNFITIESVRGSETNRFYSATDNAISPGIIYYRLKITDYDGKISFSKIVAVVNTDNSTLIASVWPTVVLQAATLNVISVKKTNIEYFISDIAGNIVQRKKHGLQAGNNAIEILTGSFASGVYTITLITEENLTSSTRFIKQQ